MKYETLAYIVKKLAINFIYQTFLQWGTFKASHYWILFTLCQYIHLNHFYPRLCVFINFSKYIFILFIECYYSEIGYEKNNLFNAKNTWVAIQKCVHLYNFNKQLLNYDLRIKWKKILFFYVIGKRLKTFYSYGCFTYQITLKEQIVINLFFLTKKNKKVWKLWGFQKIISSINTAIWTHNFDSQLILEWNWVLL